MRLEAARLRPLHLLADFAELRFHAFRRELALGDELLDRVDSRPRRRPSVDGGFAREPVYVRQFIKRELGFAETAVVFNIAELVALGSAPG